MIFPLCPLSKTYAPESITTFCCATEFLFMWHNKGYQRLFAQHLCCHKIFMEAQIRHQPASVSTHRVTRVTIRQTPQAKRRTSTSSIISSTGRHINGSSSSKPDPEILSPFMFSLQSDKSPKEVHGNFSPRVVSSLSNFIPPSHQSLSLVTVLTLNQADVAKSLCHLNY